MIVTAKQKAKELIEWFMPRMYCYMGSGMLTNTYDESIALDNAKQCALKVCDEKAKLITELSERGYWLDKVQEQIDIKTEIKNYKIH